jgi:hypothetical protein
MNEGDRVDMGAMGAGTVRVLYRSGERAMATVLCDRGDTVECEVARLASPSDVLVTHAATILWSESMVAAGYPSAAERCIVDLAVALRDARVRLAIARGTMRAMDDCAGPR